MSLLRKFAFLGEKSERRKYSENQKQKPKNPYQPTPFKASKVPSILSNVLRQSAIAQGSPVEDFEWVGDRLQRKPDPHITRFLFLNCKGLPRTDTEFFSSFLQSCVDRHVHYCGLAEINFNAHNFILKTKLTTCFEKTVPGGLIHFNHSKVHGSKVEFQPGGVSAWFHGKLVRKYMSVGFDSLGRWMYHQFQGHEVNLRVYTLYRVNPGTFKKGSGSAWEQQRLLLSEKKVFNNPRAQIITDICEELCQAQAEGFEILLMSDLNEGTDDPERTNEKFSDIGLTNIFSDYCYKTPRTYKFGSKTIDHMWATPKVMECVKGAGFAPFGYFPNTDHRPLFLDLDFRKLLASNHINLPKRISKLLKATNPKRINKYSTEIEKRWTHMKLFSKWNQLKAELKNTGPNQGLLQTFFHLDALATEAMLQSENNSTLINRSEGDPWSLKFHQSMQKIYDWGYQVREAHRLFKKGTISESIVEQCRDGQDKASAELKTIRAKAKFLRKDFQGEQASMLREQMHLRGIKGENYISTISQREKQTAQHSRIQNVLQKKFGKAVTKILIPAESEYPTGTNIFDVEAIWKRVNKDDGKDITNWKEITNKHMVEKLLLQWQQRHFQQALETPLASPEWSELLNKKDIQRQILNGTFETPEPIPYECTLLLHFMQQTVPTQIDHRLSFEEFTSYIRNADEKTSCSPSGRHYGHYKALLLSQPKILFMIYDMFTTALEYDIILPRWAKTVTTLIEKKEGIPWIHKFRTIHIVEAELQFFSKNIFARKMMKAAEQANAISDNQYGGRKSRQATSVVLNKLLYYGICHQKLMDVAFMDDDAKACFDRILPQLSQIESQKWGLHHKAATLATKIIQHQQFYVRTGHGISNEAYSYSDEKPIFGVGQGLGWSGPMWLNTSDTICKLLDQECGGMEFSSVDGKIIVDKKNDLFVDDTSSGVTANRTRMNRSIPKQLEHDEQKHSFSLFGAGHRLALHKCKWYYVCYLRYLAKYSFKKESESPACINLKEGFDTQVTTVPRLEPDCPHKTLGHWISPMGTSKKQAQTIQAKVTTWSSKIGSSSLQRDDKIMAYLGYLMPSVKYKLVSTDLSFDECDALMAKVKPILLHTHGLHRNCNRNILFLPETNLGLGYRHWYLEKGFEKLKLLFLHMRRQDTTSSLIKICTSYIQLEIGNDELFFNRDPKHWMKYVTPNWITDLWKFCFECGTCLHMPQAWTYKPPREHDVFLADIIENSNWDDHHKQQFHQIRLYLRLLTLSDLVIIDKNEQILASILNCIRIRDSSLDWPASHDIPNAWKKHWKDFLQNTVTEHLRIRPLGKWILPSHQIWTTFTGSDHHVLRKQDTVYRKSKGKWTPSTTPTLCLYPADFENNKIVGTIISLPTKHDRTATPPRSLEQIIDSLPQWKLRNIGFIPTISELQQMAQIFQNNNCLGVSDGSLRDSFPAHAWCFVKADTGDILIQGSAPVDGDVSQTSSFRAEGMGILAMLTIIDILREARLINQASIRIYCDGESVIKKCRKAVESRSKYMLQNDIELILEIRRLLSLNSHLATLHYVPGHQDKHQHFSLHPLPIQLNILMDAAVREFIENIQDRPARFDSFPSMDSAHIFISKNNNLLNHSIEDTMHLTFYHNRWLEYSSDNYNLCNFTRPLVAWPSIGKAINSFRHGRGLPIKLIHNQHATNERNKKWQLLSHSDCPLCSTSNDTRLHVFHCNHPVLSPKRKTLRNDFIKLLDKMDTHPTLSRILLNFYDFWSNPPKLQEKLDTIPEITRDMNIAIATQMDIGCAFFPLGLVSASFGDLFERLWEPSQGNRNLTATQWTTKIIQQLLTSFRDLWALRCQIIQDDKKDSLESTYRAELHTLHQQLQEQWWKFSTQDRHLIELPTSYFDTQPLTHIQLWYRQVQVATASSQFRSAMENADIRTFCQAQPRRIPPQHPRTAPQLVPTQVTYRQTKLAYARKATKVTSPPVSSNSRKPFSKYNPITRWLINKSSRQRISPIPPAPPPTVNRTFALNKPNPVGVTNRLAVGTVPTLKIKKLVN